MGTAQGHRSRTPVYSIAIFAIIGGIIGARLVHVIDHWDFYQQNPADIFAIWAGGIGLWGGILGGFLGGAAYALIVKQPVGVIADLTAPALLFVQTIGRLGDIVNGEHCARATDFIFGFVWTNPLSDARNCGAEGVGVAVQPVIAYEMIWNMLALLVIWKLRGRLRPDGMLFVLYLALYSIGAVHDLVRPHRQGLGAWDAGSPLHRAARAGDNDPDSGDQGSVHAAGRDVRRAGARVPARHPRRKAAQPVTRTTRRGACPAR